MKTYIALLRGINVGGHKKVPMAELRTTLETLGFKNVKTYIQSGNAVFQSSIEEAVVVEKKVAEGLKQAFGFEVLTLVLHSLKIRDILEACPFSDDKKVNSYFTLLKNKPDRKLLENLQSIIVENEEIKVTGSCVYFYSTKGYGSSKLNTNFIEKRLKVSATTRNYKTMSKLINLIG